MLRDAGLLADKLEREGFQVRLRDNDKIVHAWDNERGFVCAFYWVPKKGWRFDVAQPFIYTHADLEFALDEVFRSQKAKAKADVAWEKYKNEKTEGNWRAYQGTLAAHNFRLIDGADDNAE